MRTRIITSIVALAIFIPFLVFSGEPSFVFVTATSILSLVAVYEVTKCTGFFKKPVLCIIPYAASVGINVMARYMEEKESFFVYTALILFALSFYFMVCAVLSKGSIKPSDAAISAVMTAYITLSFAMLTLLRDFTAEGVAVGARLYLLSFIFAWMPDIGGYFAGRAFGKHKLIPDVSPKKTVEGFIGGILFSVIAAAVFCLVTGATGYGYLIIMPLSVFCAVISVCGDLIASLVKRYYGIKDYGVIFPGHGGVMDRFDSVIAVAPFIYTVCYFLTEASLLSAPLFR